MVDMPSPSTSVTAHSPGAQGLRATANCLFAALATRPHPSAVPDTCGLVADCGQSTRNVGILWNNNIEWNG